MITLLPILSFNCNTYYADYFKCSTDPAPAVLRIACLKVWLYLAWKIRAFVRKQEGGYSVGPVYNLCWVFLFKKLLPLLLLPSRAPRPDAGVRFCTWLRWQLMTLDGFPQKFEKLCHTRNVGTVKFSEWKCSVFGLMRICLLRNTTDVSAVSIKEMAFASTGNRDGPTVFAPKEQDENKRGG